MSLAVEEILWCFLNPVFGLAQLHEWTRLLGDRCILAATSPYILPAAVLTGLLLLAYGKGR